MSNNSGYITLSRKFFKHPFWEEERVFCAADAWLDLISRACFEKEKSEYVRGKLIRIERGEQLASIRFLSQRWKWSKDRVSKFLEILRAEGMIRTVTRQDETIVILLKYSNYNYLTREEKEEDKDSDQDGNRTVTGQESGRQPDSNQDKVNNIIKKEINNISCKEEKPPVFPQEKKEEERPPVKAPKKVATLAERRAEFKKEFLEVAAKNGFSKTEHGRSILNDFYLNWTYVKKNGKTMAFERQQTFVMNLRMKNWFSRQKDWKPEKQEKPKEQKKRDYGTLD